MANQMRQNAMDAYDRYVQRSLEVGYEAGPYEPSKFRSEERRIRPTANIANVPARDELFRVIERLDLVPGDLANLDAFMENNEYSPEQKDSVYAYVVRAINPSIAYIEEQVNAGRRFRNGLWRGGRRKSTGVSVRRTKTRKARSGRSRNTGSRTSRRRN